MSSTRLPGKVLAEIAGRPALALELERVARAGELDGVVVATSDDRSDDPVAALAAESGVAVVRGPLDDVLARYGLAAELHPADAYVRLTGDCPLIDPAVVDRVVVRFRAGGADYAANVIEPRTFPTGMDTEVLSRRALEAAVAEATDPYDREHVTPFVRERPQRFPAAAVTLEPPRADVRMTLDTAEDLEALRALVDAAGPDASLGELLAAARPSPT
jgi:spore coat polysaccharide biosynthesis protein SpsF (cytidylyltransferase family)